MKSAIQTAGFALAAWRRLVATTARTHWAKLPSFPARMNRASKVSACLPVDRELREMGMV